MTAPPSGPALPAGSIRAGRPTGNNGSGSRQAPAGRGPSAGSRRLESPRYFLAGHHALQRLSAASVIIRDARHRLEAGQRSKSPRPSAERRVLVMVDTEVTTERKSRK